VVQEPTNSPTVTNQKWERRIKRAIAEWGLGKAEREVGVTSIATAINRGRAEIPVE
jgi:hypothetical protein